MPSTTSRLFLPYPAGADNNNTPLYMGNLAQDIDDKISQVLTIAGRDALTARQGMRVLTSDGGGAAILTESVRDASGWRNMSRYSQGTRAARPNANTVLPGHFYWCTDQFVLYITPDAVNWYRIGVPSGAVLEYPADSGTIPGGWVMPYAQTVTRTAEYTDLFSTYGTKYGAGDGSTTFGMPDGRGLTFFGADNMGGVQTSSAQRQIGGVIGTVSGERQHSQIAGEMAVHSHGAGDYGHGHTGAALADSGSSGNADVARRGNAWNASLTVSVSTGYGAIYINNAGSGSPMNVLNPNMICNYIVKL